jgi:mRNA-degrading endonuclease toxin of MazEF toxin-antitoxin module
VGRFLYGQIVSAYISDGLGRTKDRPALIVSHDDDNDAGQDLFVIAITGAIEEPCPIYNVLLNNGTTRDARSGLNKPSVAKCNWFRKVKQSRVLASVGYLDEDLLETVVDRFLELVNDEKFTDWVGPAPELERD